MTHDQAAADRERIAGALHPIASDGKHPQANAACALMTLAGIKENGYADARGYRWTIPPTLDAAVRAFEVLCGERWNLYRGKFNNDPPTWYAAANLDSDLAWRASMGTGKIKAEPPRSHAADVCRLVCEVLDRERPEAPQSLSQAD